MDSNWRNKYRELSGDTPDFEPFRIFDYETQTNTATPLVHWFSWFINKRGELQKFSDHDEAGDWIDRSWGIGRLNAKEEEEYKTRLKSYSLASLKRQRNVWEKLDFKDRLEPKHIRESFPPLGILAVEIQDRLVDSIAHPHKLRPKKRPTRKPWTGTKSEFCQHIRDEYSGHQKLYRNERDAAFKLFPAYQFSDRKWTRTRCYDLLKHLPK